MDYPSSSPEGAGAGGGSHLNGFDRHTAVGGYVPGTEYVPPSDGGSQLQLHLSRGGGGGVRDGPPYEEEGSLGGASEGAAALLPLQEYCACTTILTGHSKPITTLLMAPSGRLVFTGRQDEGVCMWVVAQENL